MIAARNSRQIKVKPEIGSICSPVSACQVAFFDVGETLVAPHPSFAEIVARVCRRHDYDVSPDQALAASPDLNLAFSGGIPGQPEYRTTAGHSRRFWEWVYRSTLDRLAIDAPALPAAICEEFEDPANYRLFPDALPALGRLRSQGIRLGIISNWEPWLPRLLDRLGLAQWFEAVFASGLLDLHKPAPEIFRHAVRAMEVAPAQAVHIGDSLRSDYLGARQAGLHAVLLDRHGLHADDAVVRITSLDALPDLLTGER